LAAREWNPWLDNVNFQGGRCEMNEIAHAHNRNNSIDMFRLLAAVMVVAIHTQPFMDVNNHLGYFFTNIFPRIAVPFFFAIAGYFYIGSLTAGKKVFVKYMRKLFVVYSIWSLIYFVPYFFIDTLLNHIAVVALVKKFIIDFFINGVREHLWFFPALFFAVIVTTICYKLKVLKYLAMVSIILYIIGCLGCSYYAIGIKTPWFSTLIAHEYFFTLIRRVTMMGLPFFLLGGFIHKINRQSPIAKWSAIVFVTLLYLAEIFVVIHFELQKNIVITLALYPLVGVITAFLLNHDLPQFIKLAKNSKITADFMYYSHPIFIIVLTHLQITSPTVLFFMVVALTILGGLSIPLINNRWLNKIV
jgi:serine/alanine racemase